MHYPRSSETFFWYVTTIVKLSQTPRRRQNAIRKLNKIIIARLTTKNRPNILGDSWKFDTTADWQMLGEEFEMRSADSIADETLIQLGLHVSTLGYLEDGPPRFIELPDGGTKESNRRLIGLNTTVPIPDNDKQLNLPDLNDSEAERAKKKEEKA